MRRLARPFAITIPLALAVPPGHAADIVCDGLVPLGRTMICSAFEPNWAIELTCRGGGMSSAFIDAFSGDLTTTPGTVTFASQNPWALTTSHGFSGTIARTPGACQDESDRFFDFTLTPSNVPGLGTPQQPDPCCRFR